jgi:hypothetical protein
MSSTPMDTNDESPKQWVLTFTLPSCDPKWEPCHSVMGTPEQLASLFDLANLPPGVRLLKTRKEIKRHIKKAAREKREYQAEQQFKGKAGGSN